jgi:putative phosphoesterase
MLDLISALERDIDEVLRDEDVEAVHRMRVASRRLRAALTAFRSALPEEDLRRWREAAKGITALLGEARDLDVQIEFLDKFRRKVGKEQKRGIEQLLASKREARLRLQPELVASLERLKREGTLEPLRSFLQARMKEGRSTDLAKLEARRMASRRIAKRVKALLELQWCVRLPEEILAHHQMRIAAKRLRYTLETFQPAYDDEFEKPIAKVRKLQDLLGELHDCDVWIQHIQGLTDGPDSSALGTEAGPGLQALLSDRRRRRRQRYRRFVEAWEALVSADFFDLLVSRAEQIGPEREPLGKLERAVEEGKLALLGDVHGNLQALETVIEHAKGQGANVFLCTGDLVGYGAEPEAVVKLVQERGMLTVAGNFDLKVLRTLPDPERSADAKRMAFTWTSAHLSDGAKSYLRNLRRELRLRLLGKRFLIAHGSPDSMDEHLGPETPKKRLKELARMAKADVVVVGHSHRPFTRSVDETLFINPGSVGRQDDGDPRAAYAILDLGTLEVEQYRIDYDLESAVEAIERSGLPEEFGRMLRQGRSFEYLAASALPEPRDRGQISERLQAVERVARSIHDDGGHSEQVRRLSAQLFDQLASLHSLKAKDRYWLEAAALLHDVGWVEGQRAHHKTSLRIILEEEGLPFSKRERRMVGSIARYHRKALPNESHAHFRALDEGDRNRVKLLAAMLRLADGLDATHRSVVSQVDCTLLANKASFICHYRGDPLKEQGEARQKADLFEKVFARPAEFAWREAK